MHKPRQFSVSSIILLIYSRSVHFLAFVYLILDFDHHHRRHAVLRPWHWPRHQGHRGWPITLHNYQKVQQQPFLQRGTTLFFCNWCPFYVFLSFSVVGRRSIWKGSKLYNHSQNILCKITLHHSALIHVLFVTAASLVLASRRSWRHQLLCRPAARASAIVTSHPSERATEHVQRHSHRTITCLNDVLISSTAVLSSLLQNSLAFWRRIVRALHTLTAPVGYKTFNNRF